MAIFRRKPNLPPPATEIGHANLAKQVRTESTRPVQAAPQNVAAHATAAATPTDSSQPIYTFETTAQRNVQRGRGWYVGWSIFFALAIGVNLWLRQHMGVVALTLLAVILFITASQKPKKIRVGFYADGLHLGEQKFAWHEFENFWILHEPGQLNRLHLARRTKVFNELMIELGDENPLKIRDLLLAWLPEDPKREESRVDYVTRTLKL